MNNEWINRARSGKVSMEEIGKVLESLEGDEYIDTIKALLEGVKLDGPNDTINEINDYLVSRTDLFIKLIDTNKKKRIEEKENV